MLCFDFVDNVESMRDRFRTFSPVCGSMRYVFDVSVDGDMTAAWVAMVSLTNGDDVYINET